MERFPDGCSVPSSPIPGMDRTLQNAGKIKVARHELRAILF